MDHALAMDILETVEHLLGQQRHGIEAKRTATVIETIFE